MEIKKIMKKQAVYFDTKGVETTLEGFEVDENGAIWKNGIEFECGYIGRGYKRFKCSGKGYDLHRVIASTFLPCTNYKLFVDHIDNNRLNNNLTNLQWLSCGDNSKKGSTGLKRTKETKDAISKAHTGKTCTKEHKDAIGKANQKPVTIKNILTSEEFHFNSVNECCKELKIDTRNFQQSFRNGKTFKGFILLD